MKDFPFDISYPKSEHELDGTLKWQAPSNIAIIKYWGKHGRQLPNNPSLSLTLSQAYTETKFSYKGLPGSREVPKITFSFEGKENEKFAARIVSFITGILPYFPFLGGLDLRIESRNSFPHSSGIASSASSMAALVMCICDMEKEIFGLEHIDIKKASYFARLGSGSASRSIISEVGIWGYDQAVGGSTDEYSIQLENYDPVFSGFHDDILIISAGEKAVSSSAGHALMDGNIFARARYRQARNNLSKLILAMQKGDIHSFGKIAEDEALTLHALMMSSDPSYILMKPETLAVIEQIRAYRSDTGLPVFFTLDAGPNVHVLYPAFVKDEVGYFINNDLKKYTQNGKIIQDRVGQGPTKLF